MFERKGSMFLRAGGLDKRVRAGGVGMCGLVGNKHKKHKKHNGTLITIERQRFAVLCFGLCFGLCYVWAKT
jgi:hypothetical protein